MEEAAPVPGSALGLSGGCAELLYSFSGLHELYNCLELAFAGLSIQKNRGGCRLLFSLVTFVLVPPRESYCSSLLHLQRNPVRFLNPPKVCRLTLGCALAVWMMSSLSHVSTSRVDAFLCRPLSRSQLSKAGKLKKAEKAEKKKCVEVNAVKVLP